MKETLQDQALALHWKLIFFFKESGNYLEIHNSQKEDSIPLLCCCENSEMLTVNLSNTATTDSKVLLNCLLDSTGGSDNSLFK